MMIFKKTGFLGACLLLSNFVFSQEDLLSLLEDNEAGKSKKVFATFKTVKIGNAQSIETVKKNHLDFGISHRFGNIYDNNLANPVNEMFQSAFGLDNASDIRISFDYGVLDNLSVGIGRSKMNKLIDGNVKWKILQQTTDFKMPITLAFYGCVGYSHAPTSVIYNGVDKTFPTNEAHRFNYFTQLIIASKLTNWLSLEILPSYMYRNFIKESVNSNNGEQDQNGFFSVGIGGRIKLSKRMSFIGDYFYNVAPYYRNNSSIFNPLALGFEIETGGHVFSLFCTNASGLIENNFIPYTTDSWRNGQVKLGFRISRTFAL